jgi:hypothetical protein
MAIVLTDVQAANLWFRGSFSDAKLRPSRLTGSPIRYSLPEATLLDGRFVNFYPQLREGVIEPDSGMTFSSNENLEVAVDGTAMRLSSAIIVQSQDAEEVSKDYSFAIPLEDTYRFEVRTNDFAFRNDQRNDRRRSELVSVGDVSAAGATLWNSFSFVVPTGSAASFNLPISLYDRALILQWHYPDQPGSAGTRPVLTVELNEGNLEIVTRSDAAARAAVVHYSQPRPADGTPHNIVISGLIGEVGHINVWLNGTQIVDADTPISYYLTPTNGLAYTQFGIYQNNVADTAVVYHANVEFGESSLLDRVSSPLAVSVPPGGWV